MSAFTHIVKELRTGVTLDIVSIKVTPSQLHIDPELVASSTIKHVLALWDETLVTSLMRIEMQLTSVTSEGRAIFHWGDDQATY